MIPNFPGLNEVVRDSVSGTISGQAYGENTVHMVEIEGSWMSYLEAERFLWRWHRVQRRWEGKHRD